MSITLGSNIASLQAQRQLFSTERKLSTVFERLSSGQRINKASDDAAGLAVSESLRSDVRVLAQGIRNVNDGVSLLNIADSALSALGDILERQAELAQQAANGSLSDQQRESLDNQRAALSEEYSRIITTTEFNGTQVFSETAGSVTFQVGGEALTLSVLGEESNTTATTSGVGTYTTINTASPLSIFSGGEVEASYLLEDTNGDGYQDVYSVFVASDDNQGDLEIYAYAFISDGSGGYTSSSVGVETETLNDDFYDYNGSVRLDIVGDSLGFDIEVYNISETNVMNLSLYHIEKSRKVSFF